MKELKAVARQRGIKRYYQMCKAKLMKILGGNTLQTFIHSNILAEPIPEINNKKCGKLCEHKRERYLCKDCNGKGICIHKKQRSFCKLCGGLQTCPHNCYKSRCKLCGGGHICEHKRVRYLCKDCNRKGICKHGKQGWFFELCGGSQICSHKININHNVKTVKMSQNYYLNRN